QPEMNISNCDGLSKAYSQLNKYNALAAKDYIPDVFEVLSCDEGCNGGIGIEINGEAPAPAVISRVMDVTRKDAVKRQNGIFNLNKGDKLFKEFDRELKLDTFLRKYEPQRNNFRTPTLPDLNNIYNSMFKFTDADRNINCQACGCKTCKEMAISVFHGTNLKENCVYYSRNINGNDSAAVAEIKTTLDSVEKIIRENMPSLNDQVAVIRKEAVSIYSNNDKTAEAAKTINKVITQMIDACNNPKGVSRETISEISGTLELIRKIIVNLDKFVTKNSESGYTIDKCVSSIDDISNTIQSTVNNITHR
ncbi:MAG: hypothetical protein J6P89_07860, partial [Oscillospiraceae bacterium]|nr:hypothetical protein [Oscillospiraceae bacterium]